MDSYGFSLLEFVMNFVYSLGGRVHRGYGIGSVISYTEVSVETQLC